MSSLEFPMLSGVERASYAANSGPQNSVLLRCRPIIEHAMAMHQTSLLELKQLTSTAEGSSHRDDQILAAATSAAVEDDNDDEKVFRIPDMGSSSGPNCLANMQFMLEAIKKHEQLPSSYQRELQFFCDLPSNDFNTLLQLQHAHYNNMHVAADGEGEDEGDSTRRRCFGAIIGGTVYGRLFPASSLHLVFSSWCLHWLSQVWMMRSFFLLCHRSRDSEARSSHHLGSGGWTSFEADFWSMTGRDPTPYEHEYAGRKGLNALMDILSSRGGMNPTDTPLGRDETSD
ncbi:hypothetical protein GOP47_0018879 [Adiantum capillus-veneris]|uniref:Uncharacterized protein n=1 Tax=Adiantum capillus-veneris TaxID=13818 RepID=A0A9D4UED2_ADICA|nr:hypothetical protein GOP47_0018879 [Adiantum capillus-veneris]